MDESLKPFMSISSEVSIVGRIKSFALNKTFWSQTAASIFLSLSYWMSHQTGVDGVTIWSTSVHEQFTHHHYICERHLIYGKSEAEIDGLINWLKWDNIALHKEGTIEGYLGVDIQRDRGEITLLQEGLTKQLLPPLVWTLNILSCWYSCWGGGTWSRCWRQWCQRTHLIHHCSWYTSLSWTQSPWYLFCHSSMCTIYSLSESVSWRSAKTNWKAFKGNIKERPRPTPEWQL